MNELDVLYAQIDAFLGNAARPQAGATWDAEQDRAFWRSRPVITAAEIDALAFLMESPARAETVATLLGRDLAATRRFLNALVAIGLLELREDRYHTTEVTEHYLQTFLE